MIVLVINLLGILLTYLLSFINFDDAHAALLNGVFSATSLAGYSISKSLWLYFIYIFSGFIFALVYVLIKKKLSLTSPSEIKPEPPSDLLFSKIKIAEIITAILVVATFVFLSFFFRERIFGAQTLSGEEFYNLAAMGEFQPTLNFNIIYPYSLGNLIFPKFFYKLGLSLVVYKIFLNVVALLLFYFCLVFFEEKAKFRLFYFLFFSSLFLQPLISPSLHRNILRFLLPVFLLVGLQTIFKLNFRLKFWKAVSLILLCWLVLLFSSADVLIVSTTVYLFFIGINLWESRSWSDVLVYLYSPVIAVLLLGVVWGNNLFNFFKGQFLSIIYYSGHANASPYFNFFQIFNSSGFYDFAKNLVQLIIFYLPLLILFNLLVFLVISFKKNNFRINSRIACLWLLTAAYFLYYRQNFGEAGIGRIGIASVLLFFIMIVLRPWTRQHAYVKFIYLFGLSFFAVFWLVNAYFLRYSLVDLFNNRQLSLAHTNMERCADTPFARQLDFAGFEYCDTSVINELVKIKELVDGRNFYVYDDTPGLYYLFSSRPLALTPSFSMELNKQEDLIKKLKVSGVEYVIYPRIQHFFGVPEESLNNPFFLNQIKEYLNNDFTVLTKLPHYLIYKHKTN